MTEQADPTILYSEAGDKCEKFLTLPAVAQILGVPCCSVRRAAKRGLFPSYNFGAKRTLVRLSEVISAVEQHSGGPDAHSQIG